MILETAQRKVAEAELQTPAEGRKAFTRSMTSRSITVRLMVPWNTREIEMQPHAKRVNLAQHLTPSTCDGHF
jgi:hypothetical protein